ncbi:MAG: adenylosuccinate synthase [Candidatus Argoarchaeum ethanivorans]|uniref:Adenylosuccinate synthetase n=1 Tax=Candidatus Argoarchaeum ethanivorans TaxID=2608793 RepID=A0A8B3S234_9EURY|nr:MAG: adenylosuccinate synthase [Candidatus Argoarchaeum ethanivorans]
MLTIITGSQFGDEGKGKIVDLLSTDYQIVVRFQGGDNAGHTIIAEGEKFKLHIIPSGILSQSRLLVGPGTVMNPEIIVSEIDNLARSNIKVTPEKLGIDAKTSIIMPYHIQLDELNEVARQHKIGTTKRGIGFAYIDKVARDEIQLADIIDKHRFKQRLEKLLPQKKEAITSFGGDSDKIEGDWMDRYIQIGQTLKSYVTDVSYEIQIALEDGKNVLAEGAQGTYLDVIHGTQKYVTSSSTIAGSACANLGIGPTRVTNVIGIVKAYITRVGEGPLPTELGGKIGDQIRENGGEYGTTTGRPRRCGWLDLPMLRKAINLNGYTQLVLTKLDVLTKLSPVKICTGYKLNGKTLKYPPLQTHELANVSPEYTELEGWNQDITNIKHYSELPGAARDYIQYIENVAKIPITSISLGAGREQTITKDKI